jgi:hypothetical protein
MNSLERLPLQYRQLQSMKYLEGPPLHYNQSQSLSDPESQHRINIPVLLRLSLGWYSLYHSQ